MSDEIPMGGCPGEASKNAKLQDFNKNYNTDSENKFISKFHIDEKCLINKWNELFCIISTDGIIKAITEEWLNFSGYSQNEITDKLLYDFIHPEDIENTKKQLQSLSRQQTLINLLCRFNCKDGHYKWLDWRVSLTEDGSLLFGIARDVTRYINLEEDVRIKTRDLNERLKELKCLNQVTNLFQDLSQSEDTVMPQMVNLVTKAYQYPEITVARLTLCDKEYFSDNFKETKWVQVAEIFVTEIITGKLEVFYLKEMPEYDEGPFLKEERTLIDSLARLTGQFLERSANYNQIKFLASVADTSADAIASADFNGKVLFWNKGAEKIYGISEKDIVGKSIFPSIPDNKKDDYPYFISETSQGRRIKDYETERVRPDGSRIIVSMNISPLKNKQGIIDSFLVIVRDITGRKTEERLLHEREALYRLYAENMTDVIWTIGKEGKFLYVSPSVERLRGYSQKEAMQLSIMESLAPDSAALALKTMNETLPYILQGEDIEPQTLYLEQICKNGSTVWTEASISVIRDEDKNFMFFLGVSRDITSRKIIEDQLKIKEAAIQSSISAIALVDMDGVVLYVNNSCINLLGYSVSEEILGHDFIEFSGNPEQSKTIIDIIKNGKSVTREGSVRRNDGKILNVELWVNPINDENGLATSFMISFVDITERKNAEQQLVQFNNQLELMIKGGNFGLWQWNIKTGEYVLSKQGQALLGYSQGDIPDNIKEWQQLSHPDDLVVSLEALEKHFKKDTLYYINERRMKHKKGHWVWLQSQGKVMEWDTDGSPVQMMGTYIDISERKNSEINAKMNSDRVEAQYRMSLLEDKTEDEIISMALDEAIALTNSDSGFFHYLDDDQNNLSLKALHSSIAANREMPAIKCFPVSEAGLWASCIETQKPFICNDYQNQIEKKGLPNDHYQISRFISVPVIEGKKICFILGVANKEEPYNDFEASQLTAFLDEVWKIVKRSRLNEELRITKEQAEESSKIKTSLLLNMSHELRTPLNGILGFGELLKDTVTDPESKSMVDYINISGQRLMVTLTSIMELSQLESNKKMVNISDVNISELAQKTIKKFTDMLEFKKLSLSKSIEDKLFYNTDMSMVSNMFYYIIDNAIKFTNAGQIWVNVKKANIDGEDNIIFQVKDTGIGISEEQLKYVFEPFRQGSEGIGRSHEGNGLGLTLCKKYCDILGLRIGVESRTELGSTFTIFFKTGNIAKENDSQLTENILQVIQTESGKQKTKPLVLVVEDNDTNVELINLFLADRFNVESAYSGEMAIKMAMLNDYDLILMDINLGADMDGIEATHEIRKLEKYSKVPVIAVTGYATDFERKAILEQGMTDYISKPFSKDDLDKLIDKVL